MPAFDDIRDHSGPFTSPATDATALETDRGRNCGRYQLGRELARSGFSVTYEADDPLLGRKVELRVWNQRRAGDLGRQLLTRARAIARVVHPRVVSIHEVATVEEFAYVATRPLPARSLRRWYEERPRSCSEIITVMAQIAEALASCHARGVVHGDLNPDTILVDAEDRPWIANFALASTLHRSRKHVEPGYETLLTASMGRPEYLAPERRPWTGCGGRADQYAFFVCAYELLHGRRPFQGGSMSERRCAQERSARLPLRRRAPRWFGAMILRGLATDPRDRHACMADVAAELVRRHGLGGWPRWLASGFSRQSQTT